MTTTRTKSSNISMEFLDKLFKLYEEDGMIRCMYKLFKKQIADNTISISELTVLSMIQDEYQKLYDQYYSLKSVAETEGLNRILSDTFVKKIEKSSHTQPIVISYIAFIRAEKMYFDRSYEDAIHEYIEAYEKIKKGSKGKLTNNAKERCAYLQNSIAWCYYLRNIGDDKQTAIKTYHTLFEEYKDIDKYFFAWRYRRNYGVCLESLGYYLDAIEQYEKVLNIPEVVNEYKIYLTYCSAIMKNWDKETKKLSGDWIKHTRNMYKAGKSLLTDETFQKIKLSLDLAEEKKRRKDFENMLPDYYNQSTKLLTYKLIVSSNTSEKTDYIAEIQKNLKILESISSPRAIGHHYIGRDFYYAMYELSRAPKDKEEYYQKAYSENEILLGKGDADDFDTMLKEKKKF